MVSIKKSAGFDKSLDANYKLKLIQNNLVKVGKIAGENSNRIAPFDTGKLRNSLVTKAIQFRFINEWTAEYSAIRYNNNKKNPSTKEWAEKDFNKNKDKYLEIIKKGVF